MMGRILGFLAGSGIVAGCAYALYSMVNMLISGILSANVLMVVAGGVLLYLFMAFAVLGIILGAVLAGACLFD